MVATEINSSWENIEFVNGEFKETEKRYYDPKRNLELVYTGLPLKDRRIFTVAKVTKWYDFYLINPDGTVSQFSEEGCPIEEIDHCARPENLANDLAKANIYLDDLSFELIVGRYITEGYLRELDGVYSAYPD